MSFNIRGAVFDDGANAWPNRADLNVRTILKHAPDLIGFQEFQLQNLEVYRERLPAYECALGPHYNDTERDRQYAAIFWRRDALAVLETGGFWLSETPDVHSKAWDTACTRAACWATFKAGDARFTHLNTHLDHISDWARTEGAQLIVSRLSRDLPIVATGDFNARPDSAAYAVFRAAGFRDTYLESGQSEVRPTYHGWHGRDYQPHDGDWDRIDWILIRGGLKTAGCAVVEDGEPPLWPSDHFPVIADLTVP